MVEKFCSRSQGQPVPEVRSAAMISRSRPMSREGFIPPNLTNPCGRVGCVGRTRTRETFHSAFAKDPAAQGSTANSHKTYYGISIRRQITDPGKRQRLKIEVQAYEFIQIFINLINASSTGFSN